MKTQPVAIYRNEPAAPSCRRTDCAADCAYAGACRAQWGAMAKSPVPALILTAAVIVFVAYAMIAG